MHGASPWEPERRDLTVARFLHERWLPDIRTTVRATTHASYSSHVSRHIVPRIGSLPLRVVGPDVLNRLYADLLSGGRASGRGLSSTTVRRIHATIHRAFRDAVRWGLLSENPAARCDPPKERADHHEMRTWDRRQLAAFLEHVASDPLYPLWHLLAMTGLRRGEALGLRWSDVDLPRQTLVIRQTIVAVGYEVELSRPKSARGRRVVALDEGTVKVLRLHKTKTGGIGSEGLVFRRSDLQPLHPVAISKAFASLVRGSGLPPIRLHDLRHTHATLALEAGIHPKIVSERLGHSTVAFTLDIYSHCLQHMQHEAAAKIADLVDYKDAGERSSVMPY